MDNMRKMKQDLDKAMGIPPMSLFLQKKLSDMEYAYIQKVLSISERIENPDQ